MFRNPRENVNISEPQLMKLPSTGRPPTPSDSSQTTKIKPFEFKALSTLTLDQHTNQNLSRNIMVTKRSTPMKSFGKSNTSILKFFKRVDSPIKNDSIFLCNGDKPRYRPPSPSLKRADDDDSYDLPQFNEITGPIKKRKISDEYTQIHETRSSSKTTPVLHSIDQNDQQNSAVKAGDTSQQNKPKSRKIGPFIIDSDTDDEADQKILNPIMASEKTVNVNDLDSSQPKISDNLIPELSEHQSELTNLHSGRPSKELKTKFSEEFVFSQELVPLRSLNHANEIKSENPSLIEGTSSKYSSEEISQVLDDWENFDDANISEEDFSEGEELAGRTWMEEQAKLEVEDPDFDMSKVSEDDPREYSNDVASTTCPICNANLCGIKADLASRHVNACLDGNLVSLPDFNLNEGAEIKSSGKHVKSKFARKAAIPRPGQANPFEIETKNSTPSSAFSKLMSCNAEDTAWANAAASENSSKGKPAYQRTCPFYKIIPGFSICVDAFRYGAVQDCKAYFLSHFHSDHYIGLSSSWCHGPIYCSKVTANLVKQQLRVESKYVISLEFDKKIEIPDTGGVTVSMIPANHCPGSSLFLYEKVIGKGSSLRTQRVLHCGDFRACPAHISHPLLMPDIVDSITGKSKEQKIDVCYLDTTYLNPRYAFPPQEQVINACAEICLSLRKDGVHNENSLELTNRVKSGLCMSKFLKSSSKEATDKCTSTSFLSTKNQGRLLIVCGTYSIGKERICLGIARALDCKIYAPARKMRICAALEDNELMSRMTNDPREAQIHMQMLMEIRAETLQEYLNGYKPHFTRIVGFRPSGWTYKPPSSRGTQSATISQILTSPSWRSSFSLSDLVPQRGSTREASCFGVPYSEHSSFRELTMFVCALRIERVIPTVNVGSAASRLKMKSWIDRWLAERRKNGPAKVGDGKEDIMW